MQPMYETFEHTADLGLRVRAPDLNTLFAEAARALFSAIVEDLGTVAPRQKVEVNLTGEDRDYLLFDWLNELLFRFDTEHLLFGRFEVETRFLGELGFLVKGIAWGEYLMRTGFSSRAPRLDSTGEDRLYAQRSRCEAHGS